MQATIEKTWSFDAAHQLPNHKGKCGNLHGHTYSLTIALEGDVRSSDGTSGEGMVLDYYELGKFWKQELEPLLDHKFLNDTLPISPTTAENIAAWALKKTYALFGDAVKSVTVSETPNTKATVQRSQLTS